MRGAAGVGGDPAVLTSTVVDGVVTSDSDGSLSGHLWLCAGVGGAVPFHILTALHTSTIRRGACGHTTWAVAFFD